MTATRKTESGAGKDVPAANWAPGREFGLIEDGGWVDALKWEWTTSSPDLREHWTELITLCCDARPRCGKGWFDAENDAMLKCDPPLEYEPGDENLVDEQGRPLFEPVPDPGTAEYQEALTRVAPDEAWFERVKTLISAAGGSAFTRKLAEVFRRGVNSGIGSLNRNGPNKEILRALIWCVAAVPGAKQIDALRQLAIWSLEHNTAQAKTIALALTYLKSEHAAAALRMISTATKKQGRKKRFARYASHVEKKAGLSAESSAEQFVPNYDLDATGTRKQVFAGQGAIELRIEGSKGAIRYFNAGGKVVAAVPAAIKRDHAGALQELRTAAKGLGQLLSAQRDRIESLFISEPSWDLAAWHARYLDHPVVGTLARRLIWQVDRTAVLFLEDQPVDARGTKVKVKSPAKVSLWHPLERAVNEVVAWRDGIQTMGVTQPFKQAYREVYVLTDAERRTQTYSNRFAGHILRQHQFRALAGARGWKAPLLGGWDGGDHVVVSRELSGPWKAAFWIDAAGDEPEEQSPSTGVIHIATDQVRFYRGTNRDPAPLEDVPSMIFSEVMRDVDLFVGVTSIGNDPTWADGGPGGRHRAYWQNYSFGDLSASAKTRKEVLQRLVPKLNIAGQCAFEEKFLVVRGKLRSYKIHLGSANILMKPNDQYLCIVPDRTDKASWPVQEVLLPFEGDRTLAVILSKALMLAADDKITDPTITRQIKS